MSPGYRARDRLSQNRVNSGQLYYLTHWCAMAGRGLILGLPMPSNEDIVDGVYVEPKGASVVTMPSACTSTVLSYHEIVAWLDDTAALRPMLRFLATLGSAWSPLDAAASSDMLSDALLLGLVVTRSAQERVVTRHTNGFVWVERVESAPCTEARRSMQGRRLMAEYTP